MFFLATPGIEVAYLVFASDDVVLLPWKREAEEDTSVSLSGQAARECHLLRYRLGDIYSVEG